MRKRARRRDGVPAQCRDSPHVGATVRTGLDFALRPALTTPVDDNANTKSSRGETQMKAIALVVTLLPATALAASAFDGTWKARVDSIKVTGKADEWTIANGMFTCSTCDPPLKVKADGTDQKVTGHDYYDSIAIKVIDKSTVEQTRKRAGKVVNEVTMTLSPDGNSFTGKFTDYSGAKPATGTFSEKRVAPASAASHPLSGQWLQTSMSDANDALSIVSYQMTADSFSMSSNGQSYKAKFDGKEYPIEGDPGKTVVTLKQIDASTVEETDRRSGKVTDEIRLAAAKDGKTITLTDQDLVHSQTTTMKLDKQ
jgi:hypothetical protein